MKLRPYQDDCVNNLRSGIKAKYLKQILLLVTGGGKTAVAGYITSGALAKNKRVWFIVDNIELVDQALQTFYRFGIEAAVMQGNHYLTDYSKQVQVITAQTLTRRWKAFDKYPELLPDLVFIDEAHVQYKAHKQLINMLEALAKQGKKKPTPIIGLSATPFSKGLGKLYDRLVIGADINQLTQEGYLTPTKIYAPYIPNLKGVKTDKNGDWRDSSLEEKMNSNQITADIVNTWFKLGEDRQTIVFCVNVAHSKHVCREFESKGISVAHIDGYMDKEERTENITQYKEGKIKVLTCVTTLTKGFDAPHTSCLVIARPTKSLMLHYQILGRGLRIAEGKENCIILDHSGNIQRNGFPTDELPQELCDGEKRDNIDRKKKQKEDPLPQVCPSCSILKTPGTHKCPNCGFAPEKQSTVEVVDGELKEVKPSAKRNKQDTREFKASLFSSFLAIAKNKGHASHLYKDYYGVWPKGLNQSVDKITPETMAIAKKFKQSKQIAWIKSNKYKRAA